MESWNRTRGWRVATGCLLAAISVLSGGANAQDIEGMQTQILIPIVVDTPSFQSRIEVYNPFVDAVSYDAKYIPADGTPQSSSGTLACNAVVVPGGSPVTYASIRTLCPALGAGSQFGYLLLSRNAAYNPALSKYSQMGIHAYSRVSNAAGQGFSVESFPLNTISLNTQWISGLRRLAGGAGSPAYQSNCFVGTLDKAATVSIALSSATNSSLGTPIQLSLGASRLVRLLDVFAAAGLANGDYDNVNARVSNSSAASVFSFCTVQDNTSFGADFRIGKVGRPSDWNRRRVVGGTADGLNRPMRLPSGGNYYQLFALEGRHPDHPRCMAINPSDGSDLPSNIAMSLWLRDPGTHSLRNVNDYGLYYYPSELATEKGRLNNGADGMLYVLVERSGAGPQTDYYLQCTSGSGLSYPVIAAEAPTSFMPPINLP